MKRIDLLLVIAIFIVAFLTVSMYPAKMTEPAWYYELPTAHQDIYDEWQGNSLPGSYDPDPSLSFILPVQPLLWWQGQGCVPCSMAMQFLYYDTYFDTDLAGDPYIQNNPNLPMAYDHITSDEHKNKCFHWAHDNPCSYDPYDQFTCRDNFNNINCISDCCMMDDTVLTSFMNTCDGWTATCLHGYRYDLWQVTDFLWMDGIYDSCAQTYKGGVNRFFDYYNQDMVHPYTRYFNEDNWYNSKNGYWSDNATLGHHLVDLDYEFVKGLISQGIPLIMENENHAVCGVGWSEDLSVYSYPQILVYNTWDKELYAWEIDKYTGYDDWNIRNCYYWTPIGVTHSNIPPYSGDMNGDGNLNSADVLYLARYLIKYPGFSPLHSAGDTNGDGNLNSADVRYLAMHFVGHPDYQELYP
jgi:hypothetical protein